MRSRVGVIARLFGGAIIASLSLAASSADFVNGGFENGDYSGWTKSAYVNNATSSATAPTYWPPTSISDLRNDSLLVTPAATGTPPQNSDMSSIVSGPPEAQDRLMAGYTSPSPPPTELPKYGNDSARVNLTDTLIARNNTQPLTGGGYSFIQKRASGILQQVTVASGDVDWRDGKVHVRFAASAVLDSPANNHQPWEQPYFAVEIRNVTKGTQLFFTWNYASQAGTVWNTTHNTVDGHDYVYSNWQAFDISPGNAYIAVGDVLEFEAIASGCSKGGHEGHVYIDAVGFGVPPGLWVSASGPVSVSSANGTTITYTYTYTNNGSSSVDHVTVAPTMPQDSAAANATFTSLNAPGGSCTTPAVGSAGTASCDFGTMAPGASGTFTMTVTIPNGATGPIVNGNYTIAGTSVSPLLGPTVKTDLVAPSTLSDMAVDVTGLPTAATAGTAYSGSYTCTNNGPAGATSATCDAAGLPAGLVVGQCTIDTSPVANWTQPAAVPAGNVVTCPVSGTPTTPGAVTVTVTTGATNDSNVLNNTATATITTTAPDMSISLAGLPATAQVGVAYAGSYACTNAGNASATAGTTCAVSGLPAGVTVTGCTISPSTAAWTAGAAVPVGETVTCSVAGMPTAAASATVSGSTGATGDSNAANNTASTTIGVTAAPDMSINLGGLPTTAPVGLAYSGTFACTNVGTASATAGTTCAVSGLPAGLTVGACTISGGGAWVAGNAVPVGQTVTCSVSGTPTATGTTTVTGTTGATGDSNAGNNTATTQVGNTGSPDMSISLSGLPTSAPVGIPYSGSFTCTNQGTASATAGTTCTVSGLPAGVTVGACTISGGGTWVAGNAVPVGQTVTCAVSGTPTAAGSSTITGTTGATGDSNAANNAATAAVSASNGQTSVPTLSEWGMRILTATLGVIGIAGVRRRTI